MAEYVEITFTGRDELTPVAQRVRNSIEDVAKSGISFSNVLGNIVTGAVAGVAAALTNLAVNAVGSLTSAIGGAVKSFADFEQSALVLRAVSGATAEQMNELKARALELGESTRFSASEALQAMIELAKGGVSVETILSDAAQAALDLAAAAGVDLADAAEIIAKQLSVWAASGLTAAQAATVLTQAANASTTSVQELRYGLAAVGSIAREFGLSFEETVTAVAAIVPAASSAQDAGTSLKTMLQRLSSPTKEMKQLLDALGISMFDAQGKFVGLANFAGQLQRAVAGLNEEQRATIFTTLGGADAMRALAQLASLGEEGIRNLQAQMSALGTASEQAAQMNRGVGFALDELNAKFETLSIRAVESVAPAIISLIDSIGTAVDTLAPALLETITPIANTALQALTNVISTVAQVVPKVFGTLRKVFSDVGSSVSDVAGSLEERFGPALRVIARNLAPLFADAMTVIRDVLGFIIAQVPTLVSGLITIARVAADVLVPALIIAAVKLSELIATVYQFAKTAITTVVGVIRSVIETLVGWIRQVVQFVGNVVSGIANAIGGVLGDVGKALKPLTDTIANVASPVVANVSANVSSAVTSAERWLTEPLRLSNEQMSRSAETYNSASTAFKLSVNQFERVADQFGQYIAEMRQQRTDWRMMVQMR